MSKLQERLRGCFPYVAFAKERQPTKPVDPTNGIKYSIEEVTQEILDKSIAYRHSLKEYEEAMQKWRNNLNAESLKKQAMFYEDLMEEHGLIRGHPFIDALYSRARIEASQIPNSCSYNNTARIFNDLLSLYNLAVQNGMLPAVG